jgi:subtilisin family serine protease
MIGARARKPRRWIALSCAVLLAGCATLDGAGATSGALPQQLKDRQIIVTLASAPSELAEGMRETLARSHGLRDVGAFPLLSIGVQCVVFEVPDDRSIEDVIARLRRDPLVESVQANQVFGGLALAHNDPYASLQYGAHAIRADLAHRWATGRGVRIAVVDTGVDTSHPDLRGRIAKTATFVEGGERTFTGDSHGTAVAGVIAADADNGIGIFGVAPEAQIIAVKACWHPARSTSEAVCSSWTLAKALDFVITDGEARILNLSLGGPPDALLGRLIGNAIARGAVVVAAVMDHGSPAPGFPASLEPVIAVVGSDSRGSVRVPAGLARSGLLAAPGVDVLTTAPGATYDFLSGSSLAAAHVSGIVALLLERNPRLTAAEVRTLLVTTARPMSEAGSAGPRVVRGVVDACAAVASLVSTASCS